MEDTMNSELKGEIIEALENGPRDGLTAPQLSVVVTFSYEEIKKALEEMVQEGIVSNLGVDPNAEYTYPRFALNRGD
jgi:Fic family protein